VPAAPSDGRPDGLADVLADAAAALLAGRHPGRTADRGLAPSDRPLAPPGVILAVRRNGTTEVAAAGDRRRWAGRSPLDGTGGAWEPVDPVPPMTPETQVDAASITKVAGTTAAVMSLVDAGAVALDHPVTRFVPSFGAGATSAVTVADLLRHRAGLAPWWPLYVDSRTPDEARAAAASLPLAAAPGTTRIYSDLGFILLGQVVETAAGQPLVDAVHDLVLTPLGMARTGYGRPVDRSGEVAAGGLGDRAEYVMIETGRPYPVPYAVGDFDGWRDYVIVDEVNDGNAFHAFGGAAGHAGLFTTAGDLLRFGDAVLAALAGGGAWRRETVRRFTTPGPDAGQALGFRVENHQVDGRSVTLVGHPGYTGSTLMIAPELDATIVMVTNRLHVPGRPTERDAMWQHAIARILPALLP
jgi:CubicO group peptidase (beta-lactamase class C family)